MNENEEKALQTYAIKMLKEGVDKAAVLHCLACDTALTKQPEVFYGLFDRGRDTYYCPNRDCTRLGLVTALVKQW